MIRLLAFRMHSCKLPFFLFTGFFLLSLHLQAQTQDDFSAKMTEVYMNASDPKKAMELSVELYKMVEKKKELQTYSNYLMLSLLFENQTPDAERMKECKAKAEKLLAEMTGTATAGNGHTGGDFSSQWYNVYYPALFSTTDPDNASKALKFVAQHASLQTFSNYNYIAYAFERNGDFKKAKQNYEHALSLAGNDKQEFHSYAYYTNFLSYSGEYLKAEEYLLKMEKLSEEAIDLLKISYKSEALTSKLVYTMSIGDYHSYFQAASEQYNHFEKLNNAHLVCDPFPMIRFTYSAHAREMLKDYALAENLWDKRDSAHYRWIECNNKTYPNNQQYPLSMLPVYLLKTGKKNLLKNPPEFYAKETETHYNSYSQYADFSIHFMKATHLGFLGAEKYHEVFKKLLDQMENSRDFRHSTLPFANYAYFTMRDRRLTQSKETYDRLFKLNTKWINDVIFTFGEKAFVSYYNSRLKDGYDNYHSFVKIAQEQQPELYPPLVSQAYNNLLFTKSLSLKGTHKRKQAFLKANDEHINNMYEEWIEKKQELIRLYRRAEDASASDPATASESQERVKKLQEEVNRLENELAAKAKDFKKHLKIAPPDWKNILNELKEGEAAIEMIRFQWRDRLYYSDTAYYAAYIITHNSPHPEVVYLKASAQDLENKHYRHYQNHITHKLQDKESYRQYWEPIQEHLKGIKKVYFSPDGIYHLINISTLKNQDGSYLLDEMDIHYTTSSSDVRKEVNGSNIRQAVLIGRPDYKIDKQGTALAALSPDHTRSFVRNFRDGNISDLPGTEEEILAIKKEMDRHSIQSKLYTREQATEDKVYDLHSPDILHIATHGYWAEIGHPATDGYRTFNAMVNSGLLMSGVVNFYSASDFPDTYDGILTAYEAQNLDLENTSLVILSACETSLGHMDAGEGVYGLQRAFRAAGAQSIMTSLWKVDDEATKDFMILFYRHFLQTKNKFEAFRTAQKILKLKYPDPYFWGAFVLTGI